MWNARCPRCREDVRTPVELTPTCRVQCPLCGETFEGSQVLNKLPPELIVIEAFGEISTVDKNVPGTAPYVQPTSNLDARSVDVPEQVGHVGSDSSGQPFQFDEIEAPLRPHHRPAVYSESPSHSGGREFFKIVAGGVVGLTLAILILWWVFTRDPFDLAPKVARFLPWLVPPALQPSPLEVEPFVADSTDPTPPWKRQEQFPDAARPFNGFTPRDENPESDPFTPRGGGGFGGGGGESRFPSGSSDVGSSANSLAPRRVMVRQAPSFTVEDVAAAFVTVRRLWTSLERITDSETNDLTATDSDFYLALGRLAERVTYVDITPRTAELRKQVEKTLAEYGAHPQFQSLIEDASRNRVTARRSASGNGLCILGQVRDVRSHGDLFITQIALSGRQRRLLSVLSGIDPNDYYQSGETVVILGSVVDDPAKRIPGYHGRLARLVVGGLVAVLTAEHPPEPFDHR